ncbi:MAG: hypothetical protein JRI36_00340 [Deltaproteobacteria bacterium]|nr:hypothetical protein [Deltaproteobacteria bacterium]
MIVLSFDSDWAPQFVIDYVAGKLEAAGVSATFFLTSPYVMHDRADIEIGIHPNFMSDSTQGNTENEVLTTLKRWHPSALGSRSHRFYWHSNLSDRLADSGILYDSSIFMPYQSFLMPFKVGRIMRIPVWWSDGLHLLSEMPFRVSELPNLEKPGLKVFNFHPIHIYLNTRSPNGYREKVKMINPLFEADPEALLRLKENGFGIGTLFADLLEYVARQDDNSMRLKEICRSGW